MTRHSDSQRSGDDHRTREWAVQVCQEDAEWPTRLGRPDKSELESKEVVWGGGDSPDGSKVVVLDLSSVPQSHG